MATFKFYNDAALTSLVSGNVAIGEGTVTKTFYLGSVDDTVKLQDATLPGTNSMSLSIADANPGSGPETSWVKLALSLSGLDSATPGDPLSLGTVIYGGEANCLPIYVRFANTLSGASSSLDLSVSVSNVKEFPV